MGAWQVMTLNLPRIAAKVDADTVDGRMSAFLYKSKKVLDLCVDVFKEKRSLMDANVKRGSVPFLSQQRQDEKGNVAPPLVDFDKLVWTVGICGLNEVVKHITGSWLHEDKQAQRIGLRICLELKKYCEHLSEKHGMPIVLSRTPAETTAQRFATVDLLNWIEEGNDPAEFVCQGDLSRVIEEQLYKKTRDLPIYYTNGTHVSPAAQIPITDRVRIEQAFFPVLDGGNICHIWMGEAHPSPSGLMDLTLKACQNTNLGYFAFTRDMTTRTTIWRRYSP
jgi:ribonucleoside-triphosphate reductase